MDAAERFDGIVIVPMTVARLEYFDEVIAPVGRRLRLDHFTLTASRETILGRESGRADDTGDWARKTVDWVLPALADSRFAVHIDAETQTGPEVADGHPAAHLPLAGVTAAGASVQEYPPERSGLYYLLRREGTSEILLAHPRKGVSVSAEENTRLVQSAYEAFGQGDMAALAEVMADDIEWVDPGDPDDDPNAGSFKGKEAVLGWFGGVASTLDYTMFEPREFIAQNDKVVSLVYSEATVRDTGRAFVNPEAHVWTFRDGKIARFQSYHDTAAAAAAHRVE